MNKTELINEMSTVLSSKKEAKAVLKSILSNITRALKKGDSVTLTGFGTFQVSIRRARTGLNPRTGGVIKIKSKNVVLFIPEKALKETVN
ncbi:HU family DNA-binding protein [Thermodesulfobacteriota bacterium]